MGTGGFLILRRSRLAFFVLLMLVLAALTLVFAFSQVLFPVVHHVLAAADSFSHRP